MELVLKIGTSSIYSLIISLKLLTARNWLDYLYLSA